MADSCALHTRYSCHYRPPWLATHTLAPISRYMGSPQFPASPTGLLESGRGVRQRIRALKAAEALTTSPPVHTGGFFCKGHHRV
jgi:hypothetical protein